MLRDSYKTVLFWFEFIYHVSWPISKTDIRSSSWGFSSSLPSSCQLEASLIRKVSFWASVLLSLHRQLSALGKAHPCAVSPETPCSLGHQSASHSLISRSILFTSLSIKVQEVMETPFMSPNSCTGQCSAVWVVPRSSAVSFKLHITDCSQQSKKSAGSL